MPMLIIARLTLREASRRRLLLAVAMLTLVVIGFTGWGFHKLTTLPCRPSPCDPTEVKMVAAVLLIMVTFMFSFIFSLAAVFVAAPAIAGEVESGLALAILPRPIRRRDIVLGKWLGLAVLVAGYAAVTSGLEFLVVGAVTGYHPPQPVAAMAYLVGEALVLMTLALLGSTRLAPMTGGVIGLVLFGLAWLGGIAGAIGAVFESTVLKNVGVISSLLLPTDGLWRGAIFHLEPVALITAMGGNRGTAANPFIAMAPPTIAYHVWVIAWVVVVLALAIWSFNRREV